MLLLLLLLVYLVGGDMGVVEAGEGAMDGDGDLKFFQMGRGRNERVQYPLLTMNLKSRTNLVMMYEFQSIKNIFKNCLGLKKLKTHHHKHITSPYCQTT